ncbi:MAG: hypothetical protein N5P05_001454 [Chroococcopsis gigantea SAG 12.99]|nr:hypothetical protein [Chroococcopsis gigantea SAG 12.99]
MTVENNLRSLIPKINIILSRVVSSLANSEDIPGPALAILFTSNILRHLIYPGWQSFLTSSLPLLTTSRLGIRDKFAREKIKDELLNHPPGQSLLEASRLWKHLTCLLPLSEGPFTNQIRSLLINLCSNLFYYYSCPIFL